MPRGRRLPGKSRGPQKRRSALRHGEGDYRVRAADLKGGGPRYAAGKAITR